MNKLRSDVTVVGAGIAGLWSAKELIDNGASVTIVEKSATLADGATTRNEGWLHAGTYHSVAVEDEVEALKVVERTLYGHHAILSFAPDSIDHYRSFAFTGSAEITDTSLDRWNKANIAHRAVDPAYFKESEGVDIRNISAAFEVEDKSVNSVVLARKLAQYIISHGGRFLTNTSFKPLSSTTGEMIDVDGNRKKITSEKFLITAGAGIRNFVQAVADEPVMIRYFKAHLLVLPRVTQDNLFFMDIGEAGVMGHGATSVVGINRDGIQLDEQDYVTIEEKKELVFNALIRMLPRVSDLCREGARVETVACCKPDIYKDSHDTQSLNVQVFEIAPGYTCALPGKMTESPYLGREAAKSIMTTAMHGLQSGKKRLELAPSITPRPADMWMEQEVIRLQE